MNKILIIALVFTMNIPFAAHAESDLKITKILDNMHVLVSPKGGNVLVSTGDDGTFIVDDQLTGRSSIIEDAAKKIHNQDVKFVLNTHYHFDHSGGNEYFGGSGAIIVAHDNVRQRLSERQFVTYFKKEMLPLAKAGLPMVTFSKDMTLHYNNDDIQIRHLPNAHTDGDSFAYFVGQNIIAAGDIIFNDMYPFIDVEHGGSLAGVVAALDMFISIADDSTVIVPGHGALMSKKEVVAYRDMLKTIGDRVASSAKEGKTLEQIIATKPTKEFDQSVPETFVGSEAFVTLVYQGLSK